MTMTVLGAALLWFGWFGFNAGSAVASGALAVSAFVATHIASATATLSWIIVEWIHRGKPTVLGAASGAVAGLVAITPASGFVGPIPALVIGLCAGGVCYYGIRLKSKMRYDDSLDAVGVHGVGGTFGTLATGLFASKAINAAGADGLFFGNPGLLLTQIESALVAIVYAFIVSWILLKVLDKVIGLRLNDEHELEGLDQSQHGETGYVM
jgi:Amt family ammonium transporter